MSEWKEYKLGDLVLTNKQSINSEYPFEEIEYLDTGSITRGKVESFQNYKLGEAPSRAKRLVDDEDIIYSTVRPIQRHYGFIVKPKENLVVSTGFVTLTCNKNKLNPKFLYFFLTSDETVEYLDVIAEASTSAYPSLRPSDVENLDINIPPLPEQRAIASILSSLDDKIDLLHRQNKTLEAMAETLFRQWFVEEAKEEWEELPLSKIASFLNGLACQKYPPKSDSEKLPVLKIKELNTGISDLSDWATSNISPEYIVNPGDIIFSWSATLLVKIWHGVQCVLNQHLFKVTSDLYPKWFVFEWCKYHLDEFKAISSSHATTMGHIKRGDLDKAIVVVPTSHALMEMTQLMDPLLNKRLDNYHQIRTLESFRNTLLPKLMSGEVRVKVE